MLRKQAYAYIADVVRRMLLPVISTKTKNTGVLVLCSRFLRPLKYILEHFSCGKMHGAAAVLVHRPRVS